MTKRNKISKKTKQLRSNDELIDTLIIRKYGNSGGVYKSKTAASFSYYHSSALEFNTKWIGSPCQMYVYNGPLSVEELKQMNSLTYDEVLQSLKGNKRIQETIEHIFELTARKLASLPAIQLKKIEQQQKTITARKEALRKQKERLEKERKLREEQEKKRLLSSQKAASASKTKGEAFFNSLTMDQRSLIKAMFKDS